MKKSTSITLCIILLNLALLNLSTCVSSQVADSPWPMFQGDIKHTGVSAYDTTNVSGGIIWYLNLGNDIESSPVIGQNDIIYIVTENGDFYSIFPNGTINWNFTSSGSSRSTPVIDSDGNVYFGSGETLYCLSSNGTKMWEFQADGYIGMSSPVIDDSGNIYFGSDNGFFYSINPDGTQRWNFTASYSIYSSPAIDDNGNLYFGTLEKLYTLYPNGTQKWNYSTGGIKRAVAIDSQGNIIVTTEDSSYNGWLYNIFNNGTLNWRRDINEQIGYSSPAIGTNGNIYICYSRGGRECIRAYTQDGNINWSTSLRPPSTGSMGINTSPTISSEGTIYFQVNSQTLFAVDKFGNEIWHFTSPYKDNFGEAETSCPAIGSDGTIYLGNTDGYFFALGPDYPPIASFEVYPTEGNVSTTFWFDATNSTDNEDDPSRLTFNWGFGDGNTSTGILVNHTYSVLGDYSVILTVIDSTGKSSNYTFTVSVRNDPVIPLGLGLKYLVIAFGLANLIPLTIVIHRKHKAGLLRRMREIDPEDDTRPVEEWNFKSWLLSRNIVIIWLSILMILDVVTTYIAISKGFGYEINPFARWLFISSSGFIIVLLLKFIVIFLVIYAAYRLHRHLRKDTVRKSDASMMEVAFWALTIGVMVVTVGNNINVIA